MTPHVPDPRTLRRLAGEATPGPWVEQHDDPVERTGFYVDSHASEDGPEPVVPPIHSSYSASFADAAYIAAASPDVVLALLDERDRLREALDRAARDRHNLAAGLHERRFEDCNNHNCVSARAALQESPDDR